MKSRSGNPQSLKNQRNLSGDFKTNSQGNGDRLVILLKVETITRERNL